MARSSSTDWTYSTPDLLKDALVVAGVLEAGKSFKAGMITTSLRSLNLMVKAWMGQSNPIMRGLKMWQRASSTLDPSTARISYNIKPSGGHLDLAIPVDILTMTAKNASSTETVLTRMTLEDYQAIGDKSSGSTGTPSRFYYERQYDQGVVYFDVYLSTTAAGYTYPFTYLRILQDFDTITDDVDFPPEYSEALKYNLAVRLAMDFNVDIPTGVAEMAALTLQQANYFSPHLQLPEDMYFQPGRDD